MNKSQRIKVDLQSLEDNNIKVKLDQDVDFFEIMSMKIDTKEFYANFNADYGVLVGRVIANNGIGVENAKVSIFIPLTEEDENDGTITNLYPYKTPRDKNRAGKRYNLLPRVGRLDPSDDKIKPKQPFGSFPIKPEIVTNPTFMKVYKKYYKYTATTNKSGDYMIFGVPVGVQTVHMSVDITDIGEFSMLPSIMITNLGYSPNLFTDDGTRIKESSDLDDLPHIETQEISVDVIPFWGDTENFEIGVTRQDFRIRATIGNQIIIFGNAFTDSFNHLWGAKAGSHNTANRLYGVKGTGDDRIDRLTMISKRTGIITEKIYYYPANLTDEFIESDNCDPIRDAVLLDESEYTSHKRDGDFVFIINCNRRKMITNEEGELADVQPDSPEGIFTEFRGFITLEYTEEDVPLRNEIFEFNDIEYRQIRYRFKIPQWSTQLGNILRPPLPEANEVNNKIWRKQDFTFQGGKIYSISRFISTNRIPSDSTPNYNETVGLLVNENLNNPEYGFANVGLLANPTNITEEEEKRINVPPNRTALLGQQTFAGDWLNFTIYFPQVGAVINNVTSGNISSLFSNLNFQDSQFFRNNRYFNRDNTQDIAAGMVNTKWFTRNDLNWVDFIEVPEEYIKVFAAIDKNGFTDLDVIQKMSEEFSNISYDDTFFRNKRNVPSWGIGGAFPNYNNPQFDTSTPSNRTYFYKGYDSSNCIDFLIELGLVE